jgi:hypothetical protein
MYAVSSGRTGKLFCRYIEHLQCGRASELQCELNNFAWTNKAAGPLRRGMAISSHGNTMRQRVNRGRSREQSRICSASRDVFLA